jgi:hypothetical chaperone protein
MRRSVGLDLGTTNSAHAVAEGGKVSLAQFTERAGLTSTFRSILYFQANEGARRSAAFAGPAAIEQYLDDGGAGRLLQSLKSYLADRGFDATSIFGRNYSLTDLLSFLVRALRVDAEREGGAVRGPIVVGRPVHFAGADTAEDDAFAEGRLRKAIVAGGFDEVVFEYEPVAAAYYYETRLDHDELVLIADFGGGTSDFSLIRVGPRSRTLGAERILANDGVGIAGDAIDAKILHHVVSPALGLGSTYKSMFGKELQAPVWLYAKLRRWHHLSFLKSKRTTELLREMLDQSHERSKIEAFIHIVDDDLGYRLYRAVEQANVALSSADRATFLFEDAPVRIEREITRAEFESWIVDETGEMATCVDGTLAQAGVAPRDVDRVFMTGGTSFVPAVRAIFESRFGAEKLVVGGEMISVASGLALRAEDLG